MCQFVSSLRLIFFSSAGATVHDEPWYLLRLLSIKSQSRDFSLHLQRPIIFKSSPAESSHLMAGLPTRRVHYGFCRVNFLQGFCSCILERCPSHLNRTTFITFTISGSLYNLLRYILDDQSQWPRGLKHEPSSPSWALGSWARIPLKACMIVCIYSAFVLSYV
jgi:hypothetical protein